MSLICLCINYHPWEGGLGLQIYYNLDEIKQYIKETAGFWIYYAHQLGAVVKADFTKYVENSNKFDELLADENVGLYKDDAGNIKGVYTSKDFMAQLKALLDEYAKEENAKEENGGFYLLPTTDFSTVPASYFINTQQFRTFRNIVLEKGCLAVMTKYNGLPMRFVDPFSDPDHPILLVGVVSDLNRLDTYSYMPVQSYFFCAYDWEYHTYRVQAFPENDKIYTSCSEGIDYETGSVSNLNSSWAMMNFDVENHGSISNDCWVLYSTTGERIRVFVSQNAAKNYSVGNRKVYFTENYYNYVPEDLSVSIDDLQKSVDDLQKIIDELLKQIGNDTSEKEIEELLKQILEELRNQGGGGGGSGGGDINVDIDLSTTNSWLSKIYAKVSQIFEKMNSAVEDAEQAALTGIQESLDEIITQLKKIKHWTIADTVIDAADAVADWADLILGVLKDAKEGAGSAVAAIATTVGDSVDLMAKKFPFSIPWDILFFVSVLSAEPQVPCFEIPFNIELSALDITVDYTMKLDFTQFQWLSDLSRLLLSMTYAVGLMKMTFNVTSMGKEE